MKDNQNNSLPGANILIKGTKYNTVSDAEGKFSIDTHEKLPFTLLIQYVGYTSKEIKINQPTEAPLEISLTPEGENVLVEVVVSSRRRIEKAQDIPIAVSVVTGKQAEQTGSFNVNRIKELVPSVQLYSSNPRNTGINIRGLGSPFGLTNDGIDPGVGFYVDGVYYARPAATTLDFIDVDQIEVLRGPQGSLFGKNTTAGAFNITSRKPSFTSGADFEVSYGNYSYLQAKASVTGALAKKLAGRLSFSGTSRDGLVENIATGRSTNTLNNQGFRGQLLFTPTENTNITLSADLTTQRPDGYAQVVAGVAPTQRAAYRQFNAIIADLNYKLPTLNAFDRKIDHDTPWRSGQDLGGASLNIDTKIGKGTLTSTTAWRFWNWDPSNDRDFTGLQQLAKSQNPSRQTQITQEVRYAGQIAKNLTGVAGVFFIDQTVKTNGTEESGNAQWRFAQDSPSNTPAGALWKTPGLLEGYGIKTVSSIRSSSAATFGQLDWAVTEKLHILPGLRYNFDKKDADYNRKTYGGLQTTDPALIALKKKVYTDQAFSSSTDNTDFSGNITASYKATDKINVYGTYAKSYKPVGVNVAGLPTPAAGQTLADLAVVKPESVNHYEVGVKTSPFKNSILNLTAFDTEIKDYQTNVQSPELGVNRGYLANADKVRVRGFEVDASIVANKNLSFNGALSYTEGIYQKFTNAPLPLEETGAAVSFKDVSGTDLPGISRWAGTLGGEYSRDAKFFGNNGKIFLAIDSYSRSSFSSSPSASKYLVVPGYSIFNGRLGFRASEGLSVHIWGRNLFNKNYYEQLLPAGGNAGQYAAVLGDQITYGVTLKYSL
ncbi:TonB-dependent receptor [Flavobacterium gilvum]|nr:TonB-dependent receptor [Flavobacterium gilvum]